jgi:hypothetical protein
MILTRAALRRVTPLTVFTLIATLVSVNVSARNAVVSPSGRTVSPAADSRRQDDRDWDRVRRLRSGTEIVVTAVTLPAAPYEMLAANDLVLTLLNTTAMASSRHESRLRRIDSESLARVAQGSFAIVDGDLRVGAEGIFVAGQKVMDIGELLVTVPRAEVSRITRMEVHSTRSGVGGGFLGFFGGYFLGALLGAKIASARGGDASNLNWLFFGGLGGAIAGAIFGHQVAAGRTVREEVLIYSAAGVVALDSNDRPLFSN